MPSFDASFDQIKEIQKDFQAFCNEFGKASEADTRVKVIDRILVDVLGWPESSLKRETHSHSGYSDYILSVFGKPLITVEAKREGEAFEFPQGNKNKTLKLSGPILSNTEIKEAITQVRSYCDDLGIRYAIATNGYSWIIFRAIKENGSWRDGTARLFTSIEYIISNYIEFWNLLSFDSICNGSLDKEFGLTISPERNLFRVLSRLNNPDIPLLRNSLHTQLSPVITHFFEDIADPEHLDTLQNCYVYSKSLKIAASDINYVIKDSIPKFLKDQNTVDIVETKEDAGAFGSSLKSALAKSKGQLFLLLGGIGSGKTTFQKRYQLTIGKETLENTLWFVLDFLKPPVDPSELEPFVWRNILDQLRTRYSSPHLETRRNIKRVFKAEIEALKETELYLLREETPEYEKILTKHLTRWQENLSEYVSKLLAFVKPRRNLSVVLFFDNVDQLSPFYQSQIFLLAQNVTGRIGSITIVALREESYYAASVQKVFTAYINRKFHIASPPFRKMIGQRIKYVLNIFDSADGDAKYFDSIFNTSLFFQEDKAKISDFLKIVENSIFEQNKNIARFIDHICFGNMRMALQMFSTFLVSGATDIDKMLRIYNRQGSYFVAFHEFLRSIMLGDRMYYKEAASSIFNLFECGAERNSSHFTAIRLLSLLIKLRSNYDTEGRGYVEINRIMSVLENTFNNKEDVITTLNRLLIMQLIEVNTRSQESINNATHFRITSSGWYYVKYLVNSFSYLDLILQDTPINSEDVVSQLVQSVFAVNNLTGREEEKEQRMEERFKRVHIFLRYLKTEEDEEIKRFNLTLGQNIDFQNIMDEVISKYSSQIEYIRNRIRENNEAFTEDKSLASANEDFEDLPIEESPE
jgi:hypothetical protein